jgi:hypothetical protein
MFSKKPSPSPRGVLLDDLEDALKPTTLTSSREGDTLVVLLTNDLSRNDSSEGKRRHIRRRA